MGQMESKWPERGFRAYLGVALRGVCMGAADVVPGVSGGTMAFITGIYEELIYSIKSIDHRALKLLFTLRVRELFSVVRWRFLGALLFGILAAIASLAKGIQWMLESRPVLIWAFFFGLVVASVFTVKKRVAVWGAEGLLAAASAAVGAYILVGMVPVETPDAPWFLFLCGAVAICAMILPGISGSFILVLLGKYHYLLAAVNSRDLVPMGIFVAGAAVGIVSFSKLLNWVLNRYHDLTVAMLTGLMAGSLRKIWPWKETVSTFINRHGREVPLEQVNVMPGTFTGEVASAIGLAVLGFVVVMAIDRLATGKERGAAG